MKRTLIFCFSVPCFLSLIAINPIDPAQALWEPERMTVSCESCLIYLGVYQSKKNAMNHLTYYTYRYLNQCTGRDINMCWTCEGNHPDCRTIKANAHEDFVYSCGPYGLQDIKVKCMDE